MTTPPASRRLLLVHAHPDDETITTGATMAKYVAEGAHVTLVTCTLGEEGEVIPPELAHLAADRDGGLGKHRIGELAAAMAALGVRDWRFLGGPGRFRDSGMIGTPSNERPECFWRADVDEAARLLADVMHEVRPQVVVTYDENGGYGHPDHIQAHRVAVRALELVAPLAPKLYYTVLPRSQMLAGIEALRAARAEVPFTALDPAGPFPSFVVPDELATTRVDARAHLPAKLAALRAHATQVVVAEPFFALSNNVGAVIQGEEYFRSVRGELGPRDGADGRETDLFAGVASEAGGLG
ncbi:MAG: N-acetyl-1-D-myo-inositol-2-amino-2-deoxy-alpha-D-glucopyranoside deacetylase [Actinomycetota bacterium]|nr:N-acetyl-1-D-myo-inositol-2-amino-2-deoxy-alpha-D-glucopyranoside deacetylase [Actinomycetota bacterium]